MPGIAVSSIRSCGQLAGKSRSGRALLRAGASAGYLPLFTGRAPLSRRAYGPDGIGGLRTGAETKQRPHAESVVNGGLRTPGG